MHTLKNVAAVIEKKLPEYQVILKGKVDHKQNVAFVFKRPLWRLESLVNFSVGLGISNLLSDKRRIQHGVQIDFNIWSMLWDLRPWWSRMINCLIWCVVYNLHWVKLIFVNNSGLIKRVDCELRICELNSEVEVKLIIQFKYFKRSSFLFIIHTYFLIN